MSLTIQVMEKIVRELNSKNSSIVTYYVPIWRSTHKTLLLAAKLYSNCRALTLRLLYILHAMLGCHSALPLQSLCVMSPRFLDLTIKLKAHRIRLNNKINKTI